MSRRRASHPTISLFSFQDIITSVTAILILMVLILALELITRSLQRAATDPAAAKQSLEASIVQLQAAVDTLRGMITPRSTAAPSTSITASEWEREARILRDQVAWAETDVSMRRRVAQEAHRLQHKASEALKAQQEAADGLAAEEQDSERLRRATVDLLARNAAERKDIDSKRQRLIDNPAPGSELVYNRPANSARQPWLLDVSADGFSALQLGTGRVQVLGGGPDRTAGVRTWVEGLSPDLDYVLILTRPSGADAYEIVRSLLEDRSIPYGIDFIGEAQRVTDGTRKTGDPTPPERAP